MIEIINDKTEPLKTCRACEHLKDCLKVSVESLGNIDEPVQEDECYEFEPYFFRGKVLTY
jgi:hypothetical protein